MKPGRNAVLLHFFEIGVDASNQPIQSSQRALHVILPNTIHVLFLGKPSLHATSLPGSGLTVHITAWNDLALAATRAHASPK